MIGERTRALLTKAPSCAGVAFVRTDRPSFAR